MRFLATANWQLSYTTYVRITLIQMDVVVDKSWISAPSRDISKKFTSRLAALPALLLGRELQQTQFAAMLRLFDPTGFQTRDLAGSLGRP